mmetsp:Transcript_60184/g.193775  ORF Transcript_60184/g.193775 Transcript_60184/m.193775 type:complete len:292 (-) Transcript_60184:289-1164(-)
MTDQTSDHAHVVDRQLAQHEPAPPAAAHFPAPQGLGQPRDASARRPPAQSAGPEAGAAPAGIWTLVSVHMRWNAPDGLDSSSAGGPNSATCPSRMRITRSESAIVWMRCAMHSVVHMKLLRTMCCSFASVSGSAEDVGSSMTSTRGPLMTARARQSSWRSPQERFEPPRSSSRFSTSSASWSVDASSARCSALRSCFGSTAPKGSRFLRTLPCMSTGSCGTTVRLRRRHWRPREVTSRPSSSTWPEATSCSRKRQETSELLPLPVRPTMPTRAPPGTAKLTPRSARGRFGR